VLSGRADAAVQQAANAVPVELGCGLATHIVRLLDDDGRVARNINSGISVK
jgi:hypothetical protein